jgi:hypothetical protein
LRSTILMTIYNYLSPTLKNLLGEERMSKEQLEDKFLTPTKFSMEIERLVKRSNGLISYIEAVVTFCQENEIELETVPKLMTKPLKERLRHEAERLNYMKKRSKGVLPL